MLQRKCGLGTRIQAKLHSDGAWQKKTDKRSEGREHGHSCSTWDKSRPVGQKEVSGKEKGRRPTTKHGVSGGGWGAMGRDWKCGLPSPELHDKFPCIIPLDTLPNKAVRTGKARLKGGEGKSKCE